MGSLLSKETGQPKDVVGQFMPKRPETNDVPPSSDTQAAENTEGIPNAGEIKSTPTEEKVISNQQTQEEVKGNASQQKATDPEKSSSTEDERQGFHSIDAINRPVSNDTTKNFQHSINGVQPSPFGNPALHSSSDTSGDSEKARTVIQPKQQVNVDNSVKSESYDQPLNNRNPSSVSEPDNQESQNEIKITTLRTNDPYNKMQEPAVINWRTPVDDVQNVVGKSVKPRVGITEERPPEPIYNPSIRAAKTPTSNTTKPTTLNNSKPIPLSFVWMVPTDDNFSNKREVHIKGPDFSRFQRLKTHDAAIRLYAEDNREMHLEKQIEKKNVSPVSDYVWTIPSEVQEPHAVAKPVNSGEHRGMSEEKRIDMKENPVSAFTWTIPSKLQEQTHPAAQPVDSGERDLNLAKQMINTKSNTVTASAWTTPDVVQERSTTNGRQGKLSQNNSSIIKFDIWWPSTEAGSSKQSVDGAPTPESVLDPRFFELNVEKHIAIYSSDNLAALKTANLDLVKSGGDERSNEIAKKSKLAWDATKRRQVEDYMDYLQGYKKPNESTQPGLNENSGSSDERHIGSIPTKVVSDNNSLGNVHSPPKALSTNETQTVKFDPIRDPVPYAKDYLKDTEIPLPSRQRPVKFYKPMPPTKFPAEFIERSDPATTNKWTPGRNIPMVEIVKVTKEDVLAGLKSHQETYKLSPPLETSSRRYTGQRRDPRWPDNRPVGCENDPRRQSQPLSYRNYPGRQSQTVGYENNPERQSQPLGYRNYPGWQSQPVRYENNLGRQSQPVGYENNLGRQSQPVGYENNPGRQSQPLGYWNYPGRQSQPVGYENNPERQSQPLVYQNYPGRYRPKNSTYHSRERNDRSRSQTYNWKQNENPSEFHDSPNAPEIVNMNSIRHEHLEHDSSF